MNPAIKGPATGPINGDMVYTAIGLAILEFGNISLTLPPATLKNADPQNPVIRRKTKKTAMLGANTTGNVKMKNNT
jgi:hypothetical protein